MSVQEHNNILILKSNAMPELKMLINLTALRAVKSAIIV